MCYALTLNRPLAGKSITSPSVAAPPQFCGLSLRCLKIAKEAFKALASFFLGMALVTYYIYPAFVCVATAGAATLGFALAAMGLSHVINRMKENERHHQHIAGFCNLMLDRVKACIQHNSQFTNKAEIIQLLEEIRVNKNFIQKGTDDIRVKFVGSQGAIEHVLACTQALQELTDLVGAIHTPNPATPLCTRVKGDFLKTLLDPSIMHDLDKLLTVKSRAEIVREYLEKEGQLYIMYPKGGLEKRSPIEQEVYKEALQRYQGKLFDCVLDCVEIDTNMIGATYLFKDKENNLYSFSIKARQANDVQPQAEWGIWLGAITHPAVRERVNAVFDYIVSKKGPDLR